VAIGSKIRQVAPLAPYAGLHWANHYSKSGRGKAWEESPQFGLFWILDKKWTIDEVGNAGHFSRSQSGIFNMESFTYKDGRVETWLPKFAIDAYEGIRTALSYFLEAGGDINGRDKYGKQLLEYATQANHIPAARFLLLHRDLVILETVDLEDDLLYALAF
jgi:hypothetical protein